MFVLRALFWFAVVAVMMPQGPDLGLDLSKVRNDIAAHHQALSFEAMGTSGWCRTSDAQLDKDPVMSFRTAAQSRLASVRVQLARADGQAPGVQAIHDRPSHPRD